MSANATVEQAAAAAATAIAGVAAIEGYLAITWILLCTFLVVAMQLGFAMLEVGSVRQAHRMTVLAKNIMDSVVSCIAFWTYLHTGGTATGSDRTQHVQQHLIMFQWAFCATSVTICSGSMAERTHMLAYLCYAAIMAGIIYPIVAESAWGTSGVLHTEFHARWGNDHKYHDFAGSGVVHITGGCSALMGNLLVGRRITRPQKVLDGSAGRPQANQAAQAAVQELCDLEEQDEEHRLFSRPQGGWPRRFDKGTHDASEFLPINYLQVMGMFTLWFGWYGFNAGSTLCMAKECSVTASTVAWNTTLAACSGGFGAYLYCYGVSKHLDTGVLCNGVLSGLVSITASCDVATDGQAALIGFSAGLIVYPFFSRLTQWMLLDDPVDAMAVHASCGMFGVLVVGVCRPDCDRLAALGGGMPEETRFCAPQYSAGRQLLAQVWGALTIACWTTAISMILWGIFALSELTRAQEVKYLEEADRLLCRMVTPDETQSDPAVQWQCIARHSPLARRILRRHGWNSTHFAEGHPEDVWSLRMDLQRARGEKAETGLEVGRVGPLRILASLAHALAHAIPPIREVAILRLRISPVSEISGLGHTDMDGGQVAAAMRKLAEVQRDHRASHSPLKHEIRELTKMVQSQDLILRALARGRVRSADPSLLSRQQRHSLPSVPEQSEQSPHSETVAAIVALCDAVEAGAAAAARPTPVPTAAERGGLPVLPTSSSPSRPRTTPLLPASLPRSTSSTSVNTDRTVSDLGNGTLTPRSAEEDTPPPSIIGRLTQARPMGAPLQVQDVAGQLMAMLQAQQHLLASLQQQQRSGGSSRSGHSSPDPVGGQHQLLSAALQQLAAQQYLGAQPPHPSAAALEAFLDRSGSFTSG